MDTAGIPIGARAYYGPRYYVPQNNAGEVKIDNNKHISEAAVYVDGAYAGL